jgi:hypothetical protein
VRAAELPFNDYLEYFGPDYTLEVQASNMDNLNTPEYLDKMRSRLIENLRHMPFCPSTPFQGMVHGSWFVVSRSINWADARMHFHAFPRIPIFCFSFPPVEPSPHVVVPIHPGLADSALCFHDLTLLF